MIRLGPVTRVLTLPTLSRLSLLMMLVVGVFLAESFETLMQRAVRHGGGGADVLLLLAYKIPEKIDLALALGILIAMFFALNDARNRGELVIMATSGVRWTRVVGFVLGFGLAGAVLSVVIAGYVKPAAEFGERLAQGKLYSDYMLSQIREPGPKNARQTLQDVTFIATEPRHEGQERGQLFLFKEAEDGSWRVGQSHDWTVVGSGFGGEYEIRLNATIGYETGPVKDQSSPPLVNVYRVRDAGLDFRMDQVLPVIDQVRREWETPLSLTSGVDKRLAGVFVRAVLVPTAALLAIAAVLAAGAGITRFLTLPIALAALLFYDAMGHTLVKVGLEQIGFVPLVAIALVAYLGPALIYVMLRGEAIMIPVRGKS